MTFTHGKHNTKEYAAFTSIKTRCYNKNSDHYDYYGGRGIKVCKRWLNSPETFLSDMGPAPSPNHSIDRIDPNGDYEPNNCRWATTLEQGRNRRMRSDNKTGVNGTFVNANGNYTAVIGVNGRQLYLGVFETLEEARDARAKAEVKYWKVETED